VGQKEPFADAFLEGLDWMLQLDGVPEVLYSSQWDGTTSRFLSLCVICISCLSTRKKSEIETIVANYLFLRIRMGAVILAFLLG